VPIAARKEAPVSRRASRVCLSSIAMPIARGIIGRSINQYANDVLPRYTTRRCSRVLRLKRTVPSASYQCLRIRYVVCLFHPRLFVPIYDLSIATKQLEIQAMKHYYPCCGKSICGGCVYRTPFVETMRNVLFAMRGWAKQKKKELKN